MLLMVSYLACGTRTASSGSDQEPTESIIVANITQQLRNEGILLEAGVRAGSMAAVPITNFERLARQETWTEVWPSGDGTEKTVSVTAKIWSDAIQSALDKHKVVLIPQRSKPYYIDGPLVLRSGNHLLADPKAEIRLKPYFNTCMVRNANMVSGQDGPIDLAKDPDTDIVIEGGVWTTLATAPDQTNGNVRGRADLEDTTFGAHGVVVLSNVKGAQIRNLTIRRSKAFGIQIGNCSHFLIHNVFLDDTFRDGIHVEGPARYGMIQGIRGVSSDDLLALNAWDWKQYSMTFGPITDIVVESVQGDEAKLEFTY